MKNGTFQCGNCKNTLPFLAKSNEEVVLIASMHGWTKEVTNDSTQFFCKSCRPIEAAQLREELLSNATEETMLTINVEKMVANM